MGIINEIKKNFSLGTIMAGFQQKVIFLTQRLSLFLFEGQLDYFIILFLNIYISYEFCD
jgi:hypothetical protein